MPKVVLHKDFKHLTRGECKRDAERTIRDVDGLIKKAVDIDPTKTWSDEERCTNWRNRSDVKCIRDISAEKEETVKIEGFAHLVYEAWKGECVLKLRAVDVYFSILSEFAKAVREHPEEYRHLCTASSREKIDIIIVGANCASHFAHRLAELFPSTELVELLTPVFPTDASTPELSMTEVFATLFCDVGASYYNYISTKCGIIGIEFTDTQADWDHLILLTTRLRAMVGTLPFSGSDTTMAEFLDEAIDVSSQLLAAFASTDKHQSELVAGLFRADRACRSGHLIDLDGILARLFASEEIADAAGPCGMGWRDVTPDEPDKFFYQDVGLLSAVCEPWKSPEGYSKVPRNTKSIEGRFGKRVYQLESEELFKKLTRA